ncbi:uncharacterized protein LOC110709406 isoform X1 [Chenopodium quinoa]|uniref:uncharacterized protein LOC110709406 isoform X1 n=1 Tax=Chenopodium quinoa TaxID=63459 RepID=UPI000B7922D0|nr:uncharacterized protein LOC110709406 isoform X1 [Chenopodium quinoa]XP_021743327.1 uncharacterized protein LOC110709406 isoform X1 [Chenopodium quinoa]XP_021743336.1 uncharacterized protein LOC110709406 isoform X1 [Chenopodium quinoa]XP_021743339.1 uncharacterized protein LOC110709406 isoform X1 [Chenopodium quinoa]XP_021743344.1 uncharacterized protein LOC110709406 isoform X1 [Chenopodium quinoa]
MLVLHLNMFRSKRIMSNYGNDQGQRAGQSTGQGADQGTSQGAGQGTSQGTGQGTSVAYTVTSDELNNSNASQMNFGENSYNDNGNEACRNGGGSRRNAKRKKRSIPVNGNSSIDEAQDWSDGVNFDEREDVCAIDSEGNVQLWSGSIQPHDVWFLEKGVRFEVTFNGFCQPIRKGGSILVKFISSIAKKDDICPIRDVNWQNVNKTMLGDIVNLICEKFIIPDGKIYDDAMLKHVGKHRRQWKFELKAKYFNPTIRTRTQIEKDRPGGIVRENWLLLVEYWFSNKSKNYSEIGREARASLGYLHTNGATSFANSRDEFEIEHGREPGAYEFFDKTHQPKNGCYPNNTNTAEFIDMAKKGLIQVLQIHQLRSLKKL